MNRYIVMSMVTAILISGRPSEAATKAELQAEIANLKTEITSLNEKLSGLGIEQDIIVERLSMTNATVSPLAVAAVHTSSAGATFQLPIRFLKGFDKISSLQWDLVVPSSFTLVSAVAGKAATDAGKSIQSQAVAGGVRMILFGLNQNEIQTGDIAILTVKSAVSTPKGIYNFVIKDAAASDGTGKSSPVALTSGWVKLP